MNLAAPFCRDPNVSFHRFNARFRLRVMSEVGKSCRDYADPGAPETRGSFNRSVSYRKTRKIPQGSVSGAMHIGDNSCSFRCQMVRFHGVEHAVVV